MWAATAAASASSPAVPPPPRRDYASLFARGKNGGCPPLFLAPMEGLGDARLRRSLSLSVGGFDEACREFTRVPGTLSQGAKAEKLLRGIALNGYDAEELSRPANASVFDAVGVSPGDVAESNRFRDDDDDDAGPPLLAAQLMGSNPDLLEHCARPRARDARAEGGPQLRLPRERRHGQGRGELAASRPERRVRVRLRCVLYKSFSPIASLGFNI